MLDLLQFIFQDLLNKLIPELYNPTFSETGRMTHLIGGLIPVGTYSHG